MDACTILRENHLRVTKQREEILALLLEAHARLTAADIHRMLEARGKKYGLATVYRTLSSLEESRVITRMLMPNDETGYYSAAHGHRHCLVCVRCKAEIELDCCPLESLSSDVAKAHGFHVTGHSFEIFGLCKQCGKA